MPPDLHPRRDPAEPVYEFMGRTRIFRELTKRTTKCRVCHLQIAKGEERFRFQIRRPYPIQVKTGGKVYNNVHFTHIRCFLDGLGRHDEARCGGCSRLFYNGQHRWRKAKLAGYTRQQDRAGAPLCVDCLADTTRFVRCDMCHWIVSRAFASPRLPSKQNWCCNMCADLYRPDNVLRIVRRNERDERRLAAKIESIADYYRKNGHG